MTTNRRPIVTNPPGGPVPDDLPPNNATCPACQSRLIKRPGQYGEWWGCSAFPHCDIVVSRSKQPPNDWRYSTKADRDARKSAHRVLDQLWQNGLMRRNSVYAKLSQALGIPQKDCHMENFDAPRCLQVIRWAEQELATRGHTLHGPDLLVFVTTLARKAKRDSPEDGVTYTITELEAAGFREAIHACLLLANGSNEEAQAHAVLALQKYHGYTARASDALDSGS